MKKLLTTSIIAGGITGLIVGILVVSIPALDNLIPDNYDTLIVGGIAGAVAVIVTSRKNS